MLESETNQASGMKQYQEYENNCKYIMLAITGQVEPSLLDKTKADVRFAAIQTAKYPIALIKLIIATSHRHPKWCMATTGIFYASTEECRTLPSL